MHFDQMCFLWLPLFQTVVLNICFWHWLPAPLNRLLLVVVFLRGRFGGIAWEWNTISILWCKYMKHVPIVLFVCLFDCLCVLQFNVSSTLFQLYCDGTHMTLLSQALDRSTPRRHITNWHRDDHTFPSTHLLMRKRKQGSYWYHLFTTFGMSRPGIEPTTIHTQSGHSTT